MDQLNTFQTEEKGFAPQKHPVFKMRRDTKHGYVALDLSRIWTAEKKEDGKTLQLQNSIGCAKSTCPFAALLFGCHQKSLPLGGC